MDNIRSTLYILTASLFISIILIIISIYKNKRNNNSVLNQFISIINNHKYNNCKIDNDNKNILNKSNKPNTNNQNLTKLFSKHNLQIHSKNELLLKQPKNAELFYFEHNNSNILIILNTFCSKSLKRLKNINGKFRSINKTPIIQIIAKYYALKILTNNSFNVFQEFNILSTNFKIYKKEASIFKDLLIIELIFQLKKLQNNINKLKNDIKNGKTATNIYKHKKYSSAFIYGLYKFNKSSSKYFNCNSNLDIIKETNNLLNELDLISKKQTILINYICYLNKNIS